MQNKFCTPIRPMQNKFVTKIRQKFINFAFDWSAKFILRLIGVQKLDSYFYDVLPQHKADIVEQLQNQGKSVCFIGDGINDTIAMKTANVSISLQGATSIATDTAEIVLMDGTLSQLSQLFEIAKRLEGNLKKSLVLTLAPGISNLSSAFFLHFNIVTSLLTIMIFVSLGRRNAMLPLKEIKE